MKHGILSTGTLALDFIIWFLDILVISNEICIMYMYSVILTVHQIIIGTKRNVGYIVFKIHIFFITANCTGFKPDLSNSSVFRLILFVYGLLNTKTWWHVICVYLLRIKYLANLILLWINNILIDWCISEDRTISIPR